LVICTIIGFAVIGWPLARPAHAQQRPAPVAEFAAGSLIFADDGAVTEGFGGGTVRFHVSPRVSIGPEFAYVSGKQHSHQMLTGNVTFDVLSPVNGVPRRVTPFAVVGGGLFRTSEEFIGQVYRHTEGAFTAGGGLRGRVANRIVLGVETRLGWELHLRVNGMVGVRLGN
jgi:hypothetical protein